MSSHHLTQKRHLVFKQFNWRALLVRILVNALTLIITVALTPSMGFVQPFAIWKIVFVAVVLGLLNALVKPIIQFFTLSYIFVTYGLVVIFINTLILYLLSWLLPGFFHVGNLLWALWGGAVMGIVAGFLESVFGLTLPIVDEESVSEPMRAATKMSERRKESFPFKEVDKPLIELSEERGTELPPDLGDRSALNASVPVESVSPEAAGKQASAAQPLDIPVVEEASPVTPAATAEQVAEKEELPPSEPSEPVETPPKEPSASEILAQHEEASPATEDAPEALEVEEEVSVSEETEPEGPADEQAGDESGQGGAA
jgi:putative membrane protein